MKSIILLSTVLLFSCSKGSQSVKEFKTTKYTISETQRIVIAENNQNDMTIIDLGVFKEITSKTVRLEISNESEDVISINNLKESLEAWDDSSSEPDSIEVRTDKCSSTDISSSESCFIDVNIKYNAEINEVSVLLTGEDPESSPTVQFISAKLEDNISEGDARLSVMFPPLVKTRAGSSYVRRMLVKNLSELNDYFFGETELTDLIT